MHVVVNQKLITTRVRIASAAHIAALGVFALGLYISWTNPEPTLEQMGMAYAAIIIGLILYNVGQVFLRRYGPRMRQDGVLSRTLKGLDKRFTLVAFPSTKLPEYMIVGPSGVQIIVTRTHDGAISCRSNTWRRDPGSGLKRLTSLFGGSPFGDPTQEAARGIAQVRAKLASAGIAEASQPPVDAIIAFTNPAAKLRIDGCTYPVTGLKGLRGAIRGTGGGKAAARDRVLNEQAASRVVQALTG
ncbi:MAG: hypothetical protein AB7P40_01165 [Chloroflexota bacterium]